MFTEVYLKNKKLKLIFPYVNGVELGMYKIVSQQILIWIRG